MVHPNTSEEVISALRDAFQAMLKDPAFIEDAAKRQAIIDPESGEFVEGLSKEMMSASPELIAAAMAAMDDSTADELPK